MGKKSGRQSSTTAGDTAPKTATARAFVLKVPTHCQCDGCGDKIQAAVKDLTLRCEGILSLDKSALSTKGELAVVSTADPEKLRRRLRKATGKSVDLVFPKPPKPAATDGKDAAAAAATVQALLAGLQLQQQQQQPAVHAHHGHPVHAAAAWNALQQGGYGQAYAAYPWVLQQQQQQLAPPPEPYLPSYPAAAYPNAASWGAYAAYPHDNGLGGAYGGGGGGGWFGL